MEKFNPKRTTDDTYTPPAVVVAVEKWVRDRVPEIANPIYSPQQMEVLRTGFSRGHTFEQVETYADPDLSTDEMTRRCDEFPIVPRGIKVYRIGEYRRRGGYFPR